MSVVFDLAGFKVLVAEARRECPHWREGQALFNVLHQHYPDISAKLYQTDADTYYKDSNIPAFWEELG